MPVSYSDEREAARRRELIRNGALLVGGGLALGGAYLLLARYHVASPTQYVVRTGLFIEDISITKKAFRWPLQRVFTMDLSPHTYSFVLSAMTAEKLSFSLPVTFTVGPRNDPVALKAYARFLMGQDQDSMRELVKGIIEGETRVLAASLSVEGIFSDRVQLKESIVKGVDEELARFGTTVWTANVKDLEDTAGSEYFSTLRRKAVEGAQNQAKIDVAEAKMKGDIGEKQRTGLTRQEVAKIEADTVQTENQRRASIAQSAAELRVRTAETEQTARLAEIASKQAALLREAELETSLQQRQAQVEMERLRSKQLAAAVVQAEADVRRAEGEAEAAKRAADADLYRQTREAEALLALQSREAEGTRAKYAAIAEGLGRIRESVGGDAAALLQFLMIEKGVWTDLAAQNAAAIRGLNPKITVWQTGPSGGAGAGGGGAGGAGGALGALAAAAGGGGGGGGSASQTIADIFRLLPPLATTVAEQTGVKPPSWLMTLPPPEPAADAPSSEAGAPNAPAAGATGVVTSTEPAAVAGVRSAQQAAAPATGSAAGATARAAAAGAGVGGAGRQLA